MGSILDAGLRADLVVAHRAVIESLALPGTWWTARERTAIAGEVRRATEHADLAPWDAPSAMEGMIGPGDVLPAAAVDAVWRITNHPGTLTRDWYEGVVAGLPSPLHYVELVGIVAMMNGVDRLAAFLGLEPIPLDAPVPGEPSQERPPSLAVSSHWVPTAASGPMVLRALDAVPADAERQRRLAEAQYVPGEALLGDMNWDRGTLDRRQIELVAAQTSKRNECFY